MLEEKTNSEEKEELPLDQKQPSDKQESEELIQSDDDEEMTNQQPQIDTN